MKLLFRTYLFLEVLLFSGPLHAYIDYPYAVNFQTIRLPLMPLYSGETEEGRYFLRMNLRWINVWSIQGSRFIIDGEEVQWEPTLRYAISDRLQAGFSFPYKFQGGGVMDASIERFHAAFGLTQGGRDNYPRNAFNVSYEPFGAYYPLLDNDPLKTLLRKLDWRQYPRAWYDPPLQLSWENLNLSSFTESVPGASRDRNAPGDPRFFMEGTVWQKGPHKLTLGSQVKIPLNAGVLIGSPGTDQSLFAVFNRQTPPFQYRLGISYTRFDWESFGLLELPSHQWVLRPAMEYDLGQWDLILEYVYFSSPVNNFGRLSKPGHEVALGFLGDFGSYKVELAVVENFGNFGVTPDIGFQFAIEREL